MHCMDCETLKNEKFDQIRMREGGSCINCIITRNTTGQMLEALLSTKSASLAENELMNIVKNHKVKVKINSFWTHRNGRRLQSLFQNFESKHWGQLILTRSIQLSFEK